MTTEVRARAPWGVRRPRRVGPEQRRPVKPRLTRGEWLALVVGVVAMVLVVRGRANSAACSFVPLIVPALLLAFSRVERRRASRVVRALWADLGAYASGGKTPWAAALAFVVVPVTLLDLSNDHVETIGDTSTVIPTAVSLVTEGNTDLDEFYHEGSWWFRAPESQRQDGLSYFLRRRGPHLYAAHPVGMVPLALPVVVASRLAGGRLSDPLVQLRLEKLTAAGVAGVSLGVFFLLAMGLVRPGPALVTTAVLAVASGMLTTVGQNLWQHDGIILGSLTLLLLEFRRTGRLAVVAQGLVCGTLPACRLTAVSFLLPFGLWVLLRAPRRAAVIAVVSALAFLPWAVYYQTVYGSLLGPSSAHLVGSHWLRDIPMRLAGVLISPGRGLLTYQPWAVLALLSLVPAVRREAARRCVIGGPAGWAAVCVAAVALDVGIVSAWHGWWSGWCWGSRLVVGIVPLFALLCARPIAVLITNPPGRALVLTLALLGTLVQLPVVYSDAFRWNAVHGDSAEQAVWSWSDAPFLAPFTLPPRPELGAVGPRTPR